MKKFANLIKKIVAKIFFSIKEEEINFKFLLHIIVRTTFLWLLTLAIYLIADYFLGRDYYVNRGLYFFFTPLLFLISLAPFLFSFNFCKKKKNKFSMLYRIISFFWGLLFLAGALYFIWLS